MTEIRSFRRVFDLERRIYAIDRLRLNPAGVPVRGIVYLLAVLALALTTSAIPGLGTLIRVLPWYLRELALPAATATVLAVIRIDGRTFHVATFAHVRYLLEPRRVTGLARRSTVGSRWLPPDLTTLPDGSDHRLRAFRYKGPGTLLVTVPHRRLTGRGRRVLRIEAVSGVVRRGTPCVIALAREAKLLVAAEPVGGQR